jgi:hypothetical protein
MIHDAWTDLENNILIASYPIKSKEEILILLPNRKWHPITEHARTLGVQRPYKNWTFEEDALLRRLYPSQDTISLLENFKDRTVAAIHSRAMLLGIKKTHKANVTFFDEWSDNMAYVLGFIAADGNIGIKKRGMHLTIGLAIKDLDHLKSIQALLYPNGNILYCTKVIGKRKYACCYMHIGSNYMCNRLISLGIMPRKSLTLTFPAVPDEYVKHFIRGYFDGDGTIFKDSTHSKSTWGLQMLGTKSFLISVSNIIDLKIKAINPRNVRKEKKNGKIFVIKYSTLDTIKICRWLYSDSKMFLHRKYDKANTMFKERNIPFSNIGEV